MVNGKQAYVLAVTNSIGFSLATLPPVILDPLLTSHARFGARFYPHAWASIPIGLAVLLATVSWSPATQYGEMRLRAVIPLLIGVALALPLYLPEMPHLNLIGVGFVWGIITAVWIWIDNLDSDLLPKAVSDLSQHASIETIRQRISSNKTLLVFLIFGTAILAVAGLGVSFFANAQFLSAQKDLFLLNGWAIISISCYMAFVFLGPVLTLFAKIRRLEQFEGRVDTATKDLLTKLQELERRIDELRGAVKMAEIAGRSVEVDPANSLNKYRTICEKILLSAYRIEMSEAPTKRELGWMLNNNQFTRRLERRIVSQMNSVRDMGNLALLSH